MFYTYRQNNSGGKFVQDDRVGNYVIVEGDDVADANERAEAIGLYFDGCSHGMDCGCCGDRWNPAYGEGSAQPTIYGQTFKEFEDSLDFVMVEKKVTIHTHYKDGRHEKTVIDTEKAAKRNQARKRERAEKLWATRFNLYGLYSDKPIRVFEHKGYGASHFYDASGNFGIDGEGLATEPTYGSVSYASKNKADVEAFMTGITLCLQSAKAAAESAMLSSCCDKGPLKDGMKAAVARLGRMLGEER